MSTRVTVVDDQTGGNARAEMRSETVLRPRRCRRHPFTSSYVEEEEEEEEEETAVVVAAAARGVVQEPPRTRA